MTDSLNNAIKMVSPILSGKAVVTPNDIEDTVNKFIVPLVSCGSMPGLDVEVLKQELSNIFNATMEAARVLEGKDRREPWLTEFRLQEKSQWNFWSDYRKYLLEQKNMPKAVVDELDRLTDVTLDKLFDPTRLDVHLHKKGMVVGNVQSGKTSNYTGLICKAADAGFNFIIVLAGMHNNLRSQTQLRLDEGFLGFDTQYGRAYQLHNSSNIGVGTLITQHGHPIAHSYTTSLESGDFKKKTAEGLGLNFNTKEPVLLVVKKNKSVLTNLENWLKSKIAPEEQCSTKSLLLIDDEADNASINTNKQDHDPTAINNCIRKIMNCFHRVGYVGYTATPFANIFIPVDDTDLFPRDFIINLPTPKNYIGPRKVFGMADHDSEDDDSVLPIVNKITDYEEFVPVRHKKNDPLPMIDDAPESLRRALKCFIMTCAIRIARGQEHQHNSMLIHVSRFQVWQNEIKYIVGKIFDFYKSEIEYGDKRILEEFRQIFEESTDDYLSYKDVTAHVMNSEHIKVDPQIKAHTWSEIKPLLKKAVAKISVRSINGSSADVLSYYENPNGISVIVIGGDKLSRGLTLEGLSVSYFLRASKMYDTLMQMGRWFGYRSGYSDLCRLFTSPELNEWFRHITTANEELKLEFDHLCDIGATPDAYGLKVRSHPGCLNITAINKMRYVRNMQVSWSGRLVESYALPTDANKRHANFIAASHLVEQLPKNYELSGNHFMWKGVSVDLIHEFLNRFHIASTLRMADLQMLDDYITNLTSEGELVKWNVVLVNKTADRTSVTKYPNGITIGNSSRTIAPDVSDDVYCIRSNHLIGASDEFLDLDDERMKDALELTIKVKQQAGKEWSGNLPQGAVVRNMVRDVNEPLMLIYTLDPYFANPVNGNKQIIESRKRFKHEDEPFIGFAVAFPHTDTGYTVSYVANMVENYAVTDNLFEDENDNVYNDN